MGRIWSCKIGEAPEDGLNYDDGLLDFPMRKAVEEQYLNLVGQEADFLFSGWDAELDSSEKVIAGVISSGISGGNFLNKLTGDNLLFLLDTVSINLNVDLHTRSLLKRAAERIRILEGLENG